MRQQQEKKKRGTPVASFRSILARMILMNEASPVAIFIVRFSTYESRKNLNLMRVF